MVVSSPDLKAFLSATPFFGGLSDASLALLTSMLVERRFDIGATVVAEGEPGRSMFVAAASRRRSHDTQHALRGASLGAVIARSGHARPGLLQHK